MGHHFDHSDVRGPVANEGSDGLVLISRKEGVQDADKNTGYEEDFTNHEDELIRVSGVRGCDGPLIHLEEGLRAVGESEENPFPALLKS